MKKDFFENKLKEDTKQALESLLPYWLGVNLVGWVGFFFFFVAFFFLYSLGVVFSLYTPLGLGF